MMLIHLKNCVANHQVAVKMVWIFPVPTSSSVKESLTISFDQVL